MFSQAYKKVLSTEKDIGKCYRCGKADYLAPDCHFKNAACDYCKLEGHLESVFRKTKSKVPIKTARITYVCNATIASDNFCRVPKLQIPVYINSQEVRMELDTTTGGIFLSQEVWKKLGKPELQKSSLYNFNLQASIYCPFWERLSLKAVKRNRLPIVYNLTRISNLNIPSRDAITSLNISIDKILFCSSSTSMDVKSLSPSFDEQSSQLQQACTKSLEERNLDTSSIGAHLREF